MIPSLESKFRSFWKEIRLVHKVAQNLAIALENAIVLCIESPAPPIEVVSPIKLASWLRCRLLKKLQSGKKLYIVGLLGTSVRAMFEGDVHLAQLQEKLKGCGLDVVGAAAHDRTATVDDAGTKLDARLTEEISNLDYQIGPDCAGELNECWLHIGFSICTPTSFIVGRDGHLALSCVRRNWMMFRRKFSAAPGAPAIKPKLPIRSESLKAKPGCAT